MIIFRTLIHNHIVEVRRADFGRESALVDGVEVSYKLCNFFFPRPHFFSIKDEHDKPRHIEARIDGVHTAMRRKYVAFILVDGVERARLESIDMSKPLSICHNCGYDLTGLPIDANERQCPECGRHSLAHE